MIIRKFIIAITAKYKDDGFKKADKDMRSLASSSKKAALGVKSLSKSMSDAERKAQKVATKAAKAGTSARASGMKARRASLDWAAMGKSMGSLVPLAGNVARALGVVALGVAGVGAAVISQGATFESLRAQLNNLMGGEAQGSAAFDQIQDFTKNTPYQLEQVTSGFIKLQNQGIEPTRERMTALGDIAAANGKTFDDVVEAALDAAVGENERLKEFGIKAADMGDKVAFSFRGQTVEVEKNRDAILGALQSFGQMEGVANSMAVQMGTTKGIISNLKDSIALFFDEVAKLGVLDEFKLLLKDIGALGGDGDGLAGILANSLVRVIRELRNAVAKVTAEDIKGWFRAFMTAAKATAWVIDAVTSAFDYLIEKTGGVEQALGTIALAAIGVQAAFMGPAGMVVAAAAAGVAIGNLLNELLGASDAFEEFLEKVTGLDKWLQDLDRRNGGKTGVRGAPPLSDGTNIEQKDLIRYTKDGKEIYTEKDTLLNIATGETQSDALSQEEALNIFQQIDSDNMEQISKDAQASGEKAAAKAGESKKGKGKGKGKKAPTRDPFDFRAKAEAAAQSQAEKFAESEVERLRRSGVESTEAIKQAAEAGRAKQAELLQKFLDAGKIFDATSTNNILDVLGLTGPGSILENRPPPQTLIINIAPVIKMIERLELRVNTNGEGGVVEAVADGGKEIAAALEGGMESLQQMILEMFNLQGQALINQQGGGRQLAGVTGG